MSKTITLDYILALDGKTFKFFLLVDNFARAYSDSEDFLEARDTFIKELRNKGYYSGLKDLYDNLVIEHREPLTDDEKRTLKKENADLKAELQTAKREIENYRAIICELRTITL